jgi:hypothetical protein
MEEVQRERLGRPAVWQRVLGRIRDEIEYKERIESGSTFLGFLDVIRALFHKKNSSRASSKNSLPNSCAA